MSYRVYPRFAGANLQASVEKFPAEAKKGMPVFVTVRAAASPAAWKRLSQSGTYPLKLITRGDARRTGSLSFAIHSSASRKSLVVKDKFVQSKTRKDTNRALLTPRSLPDRTDATAVPW